MARRSRLSRNYIKRSRQNLVLSVVGIAVVIFILLRYGIPFISDTSFFVGQVTQGTKSDLKKSQKDNFVPSPSLDPIPQATKDKSLKVTGTALPDLRIELYLNGSKEEEIKSDENGTFEFQIELTEGENIIKAKAITDSGQSEFSDSLSIAYKKSNPSLTIDHPNDQDSINGGGTINVSGKTDPGNSVAVNDFLAIIDSSGNWSYDLTLAPGGNEIKAVATDQAGNRTEKTIHVNYSP